MKYVGLTDDPIQSRIDHGDPPDWWQKVFFTETEAREWEKTMLTRPDYTGGPGGSGWRYGYVYTITDLTTQ